MNHRLLAPPTSTVWNRSTNDRGVCCESKWITSRCSRMLNLVSTLRFMLVLSLLACNWQQPTQTLDRYESVWDILGDVNMRKNTFWSDNHHHKRMTQKYLHQHDKKSGSHYRYTVLSATLPAIRNPNVMYSGSLLLIAHSGALTNAGFPLTSPFLF